MEVYIFYKHNLMKKGHTSLKNMFLHLLSLKKMRRLTTTKKFLIIMKPIFYKHNLMKKGHRNFPVPLKNFYEGFYEYVLRYWEPPGTSLFGSFLYSCMHCFAKPIVQAFPWHWPHTSSPLWSQFVWRSASLRRKLIAIFNVFKCSFSWESRKGCRIL